MSVSPQRPWTRDRPRARPRRRRRRRSRACAAGSPGITIGRPSSARRGERGDRARRALPCDLAGAEHRRQPRDGRAGGVVAAGLLAEALGEAVGVGRRLERRRARSTGRSARRRARRQPSSRFTRRAGVLAHRARRVLAGAGGIGDAGEVQHRVAAVHQVARGGVAGVDGARSPGRRERARAPRRRGARGRARRGRAAASSVAVRQPRKPVTPVTRNLIARGTPATPVLVVELRGDGPRGVARGGSRPSASAATSATVSVSAATL